MKYNIYLIYTIHVVVFVSTDVRMFNTAVIRVTGVSTNINRRNIYNIYSYRCVLYIETLYPGLASWRRHVSIFSQSRAVVA